MATLTNVLNTARIQAQTDSNGLTDAKGIVFANEALLDFHRRLITAGVDASQLQEAYQDAISGTGTYLYPADMFFLKAIEVNYTDTSAQNYVTASQVDVSNLSGGNSFSYLRANQSSANPLFDDRGDWFELFPTPTSGMNTSQAIRIFYFTEPTQFTSVGDSIVYPVTLDPNVLSWRIASNYCYSLGKIAEGDAFNMKYEQKIEDLITTLSRGVQQPIQASPIQLSGWEF